MQKIDKIITRLLFPNRCLVCREYTEKDILCDACEKKFNARLSHYKILNLGIRKSMTVYAAMPYDGGFRETIEKYKFHGAWRAARRIANLMLKNAEKLHNPLEYDIICSVPMKKEKQQERGYNQASLLAKEISRETGITHAEILTKIKSNKIQHELNRKDREENVKGVYAVSTKIDLKGKRILIVDDIVTTGSTIGECGKVLYDAGAEKVDGICAAES